MQLDIAIFESGGHTYAAVIAATGMMSFISWTSPTRTDITVAGSIAGGITTILDNLNAITIFESGGQHLRRSFIISTASRSCESTQRLTRRRLS